jgi:hypothetical protein
MVAATYTDERRLHQRSVDPGGLGHSRSRCQELDRRADDVRLKPKSVSSAAGQSMQISPSDRHDIGQALLHHRHAGGDVALLLAVHVHREHGGGRALLQPADHPAQ